MERLMFWGGQEKDKEKEETWFQVTSILLNVKSMLFVILKLMILWSESNEYTST